MAFGNGFLAKVITVRLTKVTFVRRAKVKYLRLELYSLGADSGHQLVFAGYTVTFMPCSSTGIS